MRSNRELAMTTYLRSAFVPVLLAGLLAGCAVGPDYHRPSVELPGKFKEAWLSPEAAQRWKAAQPSDAMTRGKWWTIFHDADLDALQDQALEANQDLKGAAARVAQARALQRGANSERLPQLDAGFGVTRERASNVAQGLSPEAPNPPLTVWRAQAGISYEADLFGRVASTVDAVTADAQREIAQRFAAVRIPDASWCWACNSSRRRASAGDFLIQPTGALERRSIARSVPCEFACVARRWNSTWSRRTAQHMQVAVSFAGIEVIDPA
ncbi:hypothetical protein CDEF62S_02992 [Castellaniella defragrans]